MIKKTCMICKKVHEIEASEEQLNQVREGRHVIQAMPHLTADERELLISGICGKCYDDMFPDE